MSRCLPTPPPTEFVASSAFLSTLHSTLRLFLPIALCAGLLAPPTAVFAQDSDDDGDQEARDDAAVSPVFRIDRRRGPRDRGRRPSSPLIRSIDGSGNNVRAPEMGAAFVPLHRLVDPDYSDGVEGMAGLERPGPREISNIVNNQEESRPNQANASAFLWQWGQFIDHDVDLTDGTDPPEPVDILIPEGDAFFDPDGTGAETMPFNRSIYDHESGTAAANPRQQVNEITAWIDASNVYGSDAERAAALREDDGTGRLKTSEDDLLPFNEDGLPNAGGSDASLFLAGDVRANEQVALTAMHTLFVREHNRLAEEIAAEDPSLSGDEIYEAARRIVGAEMQIITYEEFLPVLLGRNALTPYRGYRRRADGGIYNIFSAAAYRLGHSMLNSEILRLDADGAEIAEGNLALRDAFFTPQRLTDEGGIAPLLRGLASQAAEAVDPYVVDGVRNFLFGEPGSGGFDLAALNIQRGRDHGLPSYNDARRALGLEPAFDFADVSSDQEIQDRLAEAYQSVEDIDVWVGGLAEDHVRGAQVGELVFTVLKRQFEVLRDADRFWYEIALNRNELRQVRGTRLSDIIRRNTEIGDELSDDVFHVAGQAPAPDRPRRRARRDRRFSHLVGLRDLRR